MRIAIVTETWRPSIDGVVTRLDHAVDDFVGHGHTLLVVAPTRVDGLLGVVQRRTLRAIVPVIDTRRYWALPDPRLPRWVHQFGADVVHVVNPVLMGSLAVRSLVARAPVVASLHTDVSAYAESYRLGFVRPLLRQLTRAAFQQADVALATSPTGLGLLAELGRHDARIWPPGVDPAFVNSAGRASRASRTEQPLHILCVGRLAREKAYDLLRPVLEQARTRRVDVSLTFVGNGADRARLGRVFAGLPVRFLGPLHGSDLVAAYQDADVFAFTSTTDTVGLVLLEAAALGLPIVALDVPANRHTLAGRSGVRLLGTGATAQSWLDALQDAARAVPAPEAALAIPTWQHSTDVILEAYRDAVGRYQSRTC